MSEADKRKDSILKALLLLREQSREGHVGLNITGEYNRVLQIACEHLGLHIHELGVTEGERNLVPFDANSVIPIEHKQPHTLEERNRCLMDGDAFRAKLTEAIN